MLVQSWHYRYMNQLSKLQRPVIFDAIIQMEFIFKMLLILVLHFLLTNTLTAANFSRCILTTKMLVKLKSFIVFLRSR